MEGLTLFKIAQFTILLTFAVFVSDLRKKKGMIPLVNNKLTLAMKTCYPILFCVYGFVIATIESLSFLDFVALALTSIATSLVVKAKIDLRRHHTWAGYHFNTTELVAGGVYAFIRHPLYTSVYIFILGGLSNGIVHASWFLTNFGPVIFVYAVALVYIMALLPIIASRETKLLIQELGDEFLKYQEQVHAFLPLRKFKG